MTQEQANKIKVMATELGGAMYQLALADPASNVAEAEAKVKHVSALLEGLIDGATDKLVEGK